MPWTLAHSVRFTLPVYHKNVHVLCIEHLSGSSYEPPTCSGVESFWITLFGYFKWSVDEDLAKPTGRDEVSRQGSLGLERRDERYDHDEVRIDHQPGYFCDPTDVFDTICVAKSKVTAETTADLVAVQQRRVTADSNKTLIDDRCYGRLSRSWTAGQPDHTRLKHR